MEVAMIKDGPVKELRRLLGLGRSLTASARMTEMTEKTARKYRDDGRLPSERITARNYRTRVDPFEDVWAEVQRKLAGEPGPESGHPVRMVAADEPRPVSRFHTPHIREACGPVAEPLRAGQDRVLQPDSSPRTIGGQRLHRLQ